MEKKQLPSTSKDSPVVNRSFKRKCIFEEKTYLSKEISSSEYRPLARFLGLEENTIEDIERKFSHDRKEITYEILKEWEKIKGCEATAETLVEALKSIPRNDIIDHLFPDYSKVKGIEEDRSELLGEVQSHLRGKYSKKYKLLPSNSKPPLYMPMEHYFVEPELLLLNSKWEEQENQPNKDLEDIFQNVKHPILIEGDPGCGKTTLSYKLTDDWTNEASYICDHFDLLFYWYCKKNISRVEDIFKEEINDMENMEENDFSQLFEKRNILLLLDAFQEASEETKEKIFPYLEKKNSNITIIVTCRTGHINLKHRKLTEYYETFQCDQSHHSRLIVWNTRIKITGFSDENMKTYLKKYFEDDENKLCKALSYINDGNSKLFKCPLYVFYLAYYINECPTKTEANLINSKTELYKMIVNTLVEQYVKKNKEINITNTQIDIFHRENKMLKEDFLHLAEITSKKIKSDPSNNLLSNIPQELENNNELIKFLTKHLCFSDNHEVLIECKFIDESMFHFFGAFHTHNLEIIEKIKEEIDSYLRKLFLSNNILLYAFLAGFLQEKSNILFGSFVSFNYAVNIFNDNFQNILLEIKNKEKSILETLKNFQNEKWFSLNVDGILKDWYSELIKNSGPLKELYLNFSNHGDENNYDYIPQNTSIDSIIIVLDSKIVSEIINFLKTKNFKLKKVEMFLKLDENVSYNEINDEIKNLFEFLEKKQISLTCDFHKKALNPELQRPENTDVYDNIIENFIPILNDLHQLNQLSLYHIHPMLFQSMIPEIKRFIKERKNLNGLYVVLLPSDSELNLKISSFKKFFKVVSKSNIKCFAFQHELENDLSLSKFFNKKSWDYLCLCGKFKHKFNQNTIPLSVMHLDCRGYIDLKDSNKTKFLNNYKGVRKLTCFDNLIKNVNEDHNCIQNMYETVEEIDVLLQNELNHKWFKPFKKIKSICIRFFTASEGNTAYELCLIVSNIRTIETVSLYTLDENKHITILTVVNHLTKLEQKISIELHTNLQPVPDSVENFAKLLKLCFRKKILKKFSFYIELDKETIFMPSFAKYFFDRNKFQISSEECNDITFSKFPVLDKKLGFCNKLIKSFCISACEEVPLWIQPLKITLLFLFLLLLLLFFIIIISIIVI